ncbi:hypothetical protein ALC62_08990 [Cyphomyrmex costatus]|uniref:Uncharacterized protein n=1 Tax=Cyphomyrmex costatus TaxID=456900 RepID=A0A151IG92_9HYME|nr:hypothetical protein ALC62_08990 [Cyphomyrmex costatus]
MNNDALIAIVNDFLNSSDDSDSESDADIDELLLLNMNRIIRGKRPRLQHYIDVIASYDDQEFKSNFRLHRDTCDYILDLIRADLEKWPQYFGKYPIVVCNADMRFIHCYAGQPGSVHETQGILVSWWMYLVLHLSGTISLPFSS